MRNFALLIETKAGGFDALSVSTDTDMTALSHDELCAHLITKSEVDADDVLSAVAAPLIETVYIGGAPCTP